MAESPVMHGEIVERLREALAKSDFGHLEPALAKHARFGNCLGAPQVVHAVPELDPMLTTSAIYFYVNDADALFAEWRASGVSGQFHEPQNTEYGLREGAHVDLDGNLLRFGSPVASERPRNRLSLTR